MSQPKQIPTIETHETSQSEDSPEPFTIPSQDEPDADPKGKQHQANPTLSYGTWTMTCKTLASSKDEHRDYAQNAPCTGSPTECEADRT